MTEAKGVGISKTMFIVGLIVAILASSLISVMAAMQWALIQGPKGDKGETGATGSQGLQGSQGIQGPQGPAGPATNFARWNLTWWTVEFNIAAVQWGAMVGTSTWGAVFDHGFGNNVLFGGYSDYIGFQANMTINMQRDGPVHFVIGSDDGSQLYVDNELWIDNWGFHSYGEMGVTRDLPKGMHTLTLWYYDWTAGARVSFNCDPDILMWNP